MMKNLSLIFLVTVLLCITVYIGVYIGRTSSQNVMHISDVTKEQSEIFIEKIDLNDASVQELADIPGVETSIAKAIIAYRDEYGPYYKVKELLDVEGITEDLYEILKRYVTVNDE